jgi:hypothetical protein
LAILEQLTVGGPLTISRHKPKKAPPIGPGAVRRLVGIEVGVVSGVFNLESPGVDAPGWRLRHEEAYHAA